MIGGYKLVLASSVGERDGLGLELARDDGVCVAEVFEDDETGLRTVSCNAVRLGSRVGCQGCVVAGQTGAASVGVVRSAKTESPLQRLRCPILPVFVVLCQPRASSLRGIWVS